MKNAVWGMLRQLKARLLEGCNFLCLMVNWWRYRLLRKPVNPNAEVIISLTSYPPRFPVLHLTLMSLLSQRGSNHAVVLWVAHADIELLPLAVKGLAKYGLIIQACDDLRSYKKLIPALQQYPESIVVTADDDAFYWRDWLAELLAAYRPGEKEVVCHRMHYVRLSPEGDVLPYLQWDFDSESVRASNLNFPTGIGGVLYPPGIFHIDVLDVKKIEKLCPQGDDIWFFWMARMAGAKTKRVMGRHDLHCWEGSQDVALWRSNATGGKNDEQIKNMIKEYGFCLGEDASGLQDNIGE